VAALDQDVLGLDVAVDEPLRVREVQRLADLGGEPERLGKGDEGLPLEDLTERAAFHVRHHEEEPVAGLA
jgi:hypothetical protein